MSDETPRLPWPIPDPRARHWAGQYADMHPIVEGLTIPDGIPASAASVMTTARELIRHSYYRHEFNNVAVTVSIIAIEAALTDRYGKGTLAQLIDKAAADGARTPEQQDMLHTGRKIRKAVPSPTRESSAIQPSDCLTMP